MMSALGRRMRRARFRRMGAITESTGRMRVRMSGNVRFSSRSASAEAFSSRPSKGPKAVTRIGMGLPPQSSQYRIRPQSSHWVSSLAVCTFITVEAMSFMWQPSHFPSRIGATARPSLDFIKRV